VTVDEVGSRLQICSGCAHEIIRIRKMASSGLLCRVALVRTDISDELSASFIRETRIGELETKLALTSNRRTLRRNSKSVSSYR
jgi:hypothetical protein